jgi:FixJ family two-component response regulator
MTTEQSVFIVDDDPADCKLVAALAKTVGANAELFPSAETFLERCDRATAGCLVLDLWLPGMSGLELLNAMHRDGIRLPAIATSAYADVAITVRVMQQGAVTLLEKPYRGEELRDAMRQALALDIQIRHNASRVADVKDQLASLTPSEQRVLALIVAGKTNKSISQILVMPLRTVESRRHGLMVKFKVDSLAALVQIITEERLTSCEAGAGRASVAPPLADHGAMISHSPQSYALRLHGPAMGD